MIIGITGKMHSGKSAVAEYLLRSLPKAKLVKLAQPLYDMQNYCYMRANLGEPSTKDRKLLQFLGTDWGRDKDKNLWVNIWELDVKTELLFGDSKHIVCDDVRFDNEAAKIKEMGGFILGVEADDAVRQARGKIVNSGHASESGVFRDFLRATIYNNGTKGDLHKNLDYLLEVLKHEKP